MTDFQNSLTSASLNAALTQHPFVSAIIYRPRVGSANDLAKQHASEGAPEGLLVIVDEQTSGRGRLGRHWWAPARSALLMSLLFRPRLVSSQCDGLTQSTVARDAASTAQQLVMLCALSAADAVTDLTALPVDLKWPNDLVLRGRKLAGVLAESIFEGHRLEAIVVGMGLNVNTDFAAAPPFIAPATSLRIELGRPVERMPLLVAYLDGVGRRYAQLKTGMSPFDEWASRLVTLGQHVTAHLIDVSVPGMDNIKRGMPQYLSGLAEGVDVDGALLLRTADGTVHRLLAGDVSLQDAASPQIPSDPEED